MDLFQRQHGHQAGHDRDVDSGRAAFFNEAVINGVVEKELRGDEGGTGVDFAFQGVEVGFERGGLGVFFRITADAEAEIGVAGLKQGDELVGVAKAVGRGRERGRALGRIAPEGHDVAKTAGVDAIGEVMQLGARVADAGEVRHDGEAELMAQQRTDLRGAFPGGAAGPVGYRNKVRRNTAEGGRGGAEGLDAGVVLGWEKFKGAQWTAEREKVGNGAVGRGRYRGGRHNISTHGQVMICVKIGVGRPRYLPGSGACV